MCGARTFSNSLAQIRRPHRRNSALMERERGPAGERNPFLNHPTDPQAEISRAPRGGPAGRSSGEAGQVRRPGATVERVRREGRRGRREADGATRQWNREPLEGVRQCLPGNTSFTLAASAPSRDATEKQRPMPHRMRGGRLDLRPLDSVRDLETAGGDDPSARRATSDPSSSRLWPPSSRPASSVASSSSSSGRSFLWPCGTPAVCFWSAAGFS